MKLDKLPSPIIQKVIHWLGKKAHIDALRNFALMDKKHFLEVNLMYMIPNRKVFSWLKDIYPLDWAFKKTLFVDNAERSFETSWYIYALFTLDTGLQKYIEDRCREYDEQRCMPVLKNQLQDFLQNGITYQVKNTGENHFTSRYSLLPIFSAYDEAIKHQTLIDKYIVINRKYIEKLAREQGHLPIHMLKEMCKKDGFNPIKGGLSALDSTQIIANDWVEPVDDTGYGGHTFAIMGNAKQPFKTNRFDQFTKLDFDKKFIIREYKDDFWLDMLNLVALSMLTFSIKGILFSDTYDEKSANGTLLALSLVAFIVIDSIKNPPPDRASLRERYLPKDYADYPKVIEIGSNFETKDIKSLEHNFRMFKKLDAQRNSELNEVSKRLQVF